MIKRGSPSGPPVRPCSNPVLIAHADCRLLLGRHSPMRQVTVKSDAYSTHGVALPSMWVVGGATGAGDCS